MLTRHCGYFSRRRILPEPQANVCFSSLQEYVKYVAARMAQACRRNPGNSSPVAWLGYVHWHSLSFFDQARVVLAAKRYEEAC